VVFNGEIYNYQELRDDLIRKGHRFRTNSDTETLVHLYEEEGTTAASATGMFAYCIWDSRSARSAGSRPFGKKPLYYARRQRLLFASELKCLRMAGVPLDLDTDALRLYFQFTYIAEPYSPFKAIRKLMPGCWLECSSMARSSRAATGNCLLFRKKTRMGATKPRPANRYASCSMKQYASA